jgi:hypothetical protein
MSMVFVEYTNIWVKADLRADPVPWARECVRHRAAEVNVHLQQNLIHVLADVLIPALERDPEEDPPTIMVYYLYPFVDQPIITSVKIRTSDLDEETTFEDLADDLRMPAEMLEQPPHEEMVDTRSGPALHVIQRYREPVDPHVEDILESEAFAWILHDDDGPLLVSLSTAYVNLSAAAAWRPELLRLATTLTLEPDPDEETG